ncbi:MAG TPA: sensor histidine kinase [Acidimicrobiales bacterium]
MSWSEHLTDRYRSLDPLVVDGLLAGVLTIIGLVTVFSPEVIGDYREPGALAVVSALAVCAPVAVRRRVPFSALMVSAGAVSIHILAKWPEGSLPLAALFATYSAGAWCATRRSVLALALVGVTIIGLGQSGAPALEGLRSLGVLAQFAAVWAIGVAVRNRRAAGDARVREADERAEAEHQSAARALAEERLRIAQELHDVVAHSMSVIAVQAGAGAHVIDERPEQARAALEAISSVSRSTLTELRRLLGVLREGDGSRSNTPAPGLADLPRLIEDVRAAGVPVTLHVEGAPDSVHPGIELSAYRVVQEALTNVIKHAGFPSRVDVFVRHEPGSLAIEVVDDGRGLAARADSAGPSDGAGQGLLGMRERVEVWGGELRTGPAPGGGFRVVARLPYGEL